MLFTTVEPQSALRQKTMKVEERNYKNVEIYVASEIPNEFPVWPKKGAEGIPIMDVVPKAGPPLIIETPPPSVPSAGSATGGEVAVVVPVNNGKMQQHSSQHLSIVFISA